jgi:hypothetical protein
MMAGSLALLVQNSVEVSPAASSLVLEVVGAEVSAAIEESLYVPNSALSNWLDTVE